MCSGPGVSDILLKIGGTGALTAGLIGILAELHIIPYRDMFELSPRRIVFALSDAGLRTQYFLHFGAMAVAGLVALPGIFALRQLLREWTRAWLLAAFLLTSIGLMVFSYASVVNIVTFPRLAIAVSTGKTTLVEAIGIAGKVNAHTIAVVTGGGTAFLAGILLFSYAIWRTSLLSRWVAALGFTATFLLIVFGALIYSDRMPFIWGLTFPPPPEYLLSFWFILVGLNLIRMGVMSGKVKETLGKLK